MVDPVNEHRNGTPCQSTYGCGDFLNDHEGIRGYETFREHLAVDWLTGGLEVSDSEPEEETVVVSRQAFEELTRLDESQCDGWLAVLSCALAAAEGPLPRAWEG